MISEKVLILDRAQTLQKIKRIAFEIYENNFREDDLVLAGIYPNGYQLAGYLYNELALISPMRLSLVRIDMDKDNPLQSAVRIDIPESSITDKSVVIVDDVLNSGRTMMYALKPFLQTEVKKLHTAVMVDRAHKKFPISADYVGYSLSTILQEFIVVDMTEEGFGVYLR